MNMIAKISSPDVIHDMQ